MRVKKFRAHPSIHYSPSRRSNDPLGNSLARETGKIHGGAIRKGGSHKIQERPRDGFMVAGRILREEQPGLVLRVDELKWKS